MTPTPTPPASVGTPRTDELAVQLYREDVTGCAEAIDYVPAPFARQLERELSAARRDGERMREALEHYAGLGDVDLAAVALAALEKP
jgi:hypothetical protein